MKMRNRVKNLEARQRGHKAIQDKQTRENSGFHRPGSLKK